MKIIFKKNNYSFYDVLNFFIAQKTKFTVETSRQTTVFKNDILKINFVNEKTSKGVFLAKNLIIKDYLNSGLDLSDIPTKKINYFNFDNLKNIKKCFCVDINKAYPTSLFNMGIITKRTFDFLLKLPKHERLKSIGICAAKKYITTYENGNIIDFKIKESDFKNIYFAACYDIDNIMIDVLNNFKTVFYWFDGVFTEDYNISLKIAEYIEKKGFKTKIENIENLKVLKRENILIYFKEGKQKVLYLPNKKVQTDKNIIKFLNEIK